MYSASQGLVIYECPTVVLGAWFTEEACLSLGVLLLSVIILRRCGRLNYMF